MLILSAIICSVIFASCASSRHASANIHVTHKARSKPCKLTNHWRTLMMQNGHFAFDPTRNCRGLNEILSAVYKDHNFNFCAADPNVVFEYINQSLPDLKANKRPQPCEVQQWYYDNYGGKLKQGFCKNATEIAVQVDISRKKDAAQTQPYSTVIHSARTLCSQKFMSDLQSIGDPDITGIGVLASEVIGMGLLSCFQIAAFLRMPKKSWPSSGLLRTIRHFCLTATVLASSTIIAALVTFWHRRPKSDILYADFGYTSFYDNVMLALVPPLSVVPAIVLVMMTPTALGGKKREEKRRDWTQPTIGLIYLACIGVTWKIWSAGVRGQYNPTYINFGGRLRIHVSSFLYKHASSYILCVCILMVALPVAGLGAIGVLYALDSAQLTASGHLEQRVLHLMNGFRCVYFFWGAAQLAIFVYIRGQAISQAQGITPETNWGFGQVLAIFTWLPLIFEIISKIDFYRLIVTISWSKRGRVSK